MNRKRIMRNTLLVLLSIALLYVGDLFLGNPISCLRVKHHAQAYLEGTYPGQLQLQMDEIYYDWYSGGAYEIDVTSPVSRDTRFQLRYDRLGNFVQDTYDLAVASGNNTLSRLLAEYEAAILNALREVSGDDRIMTGLSALDPYSGQSVPLEQGIDPKKLILNETYDVAALGWDYGYLVLTLWVTPEELTLEKAADYLLAVKNALEEAGVGFAGVELFLTVGESSDSWQLLALNMLTYEDLEAENLSDYLKQFVVES